MDWDTQKLADQNFPVRNITQFKINLTLITKSQYFIISRVENVNNFMIGKGNHFLWQIYRKKQFYSVDGWVHGACYFTNFLFIYLEATAGTYELRSYGGEQKGRQGVPYLKKRSHFGCFAGWYSRGMTNLLLCSYNIHLHLIQYSYDILFNFLYCK